VRRGSGWTVGVLTMALTTAPLGVGHADNTKGSGNSKSGDSSKSDGNSSKNDSESASAGTAIALAAIVVGAVVLGVISTVRSMRGDRQTQAMRLQRHLRDHRAALIHDVALARGPALDELLVGMGLSAYEQARVRTRLVGSDEQLAALVALDGTLELDDTARFAAALTGAVRAAVSAARFEALLAVAEG
jgi:hypothetical protein